MTLFVANERYGLYWMGVCAVMGTACWIERVHIDIEVKRLFHATVNCLMLDQWGMLTYYNFLLLFKPTDAQYLLTYILTYLLHGAESFLRS